jgi:hypothetical protein
MIRRPRTTEAIVVLPVVGIVVVAPRPAKAVSAPPRLLQKSKEQTEKSKKD